MRGERAAWKRTVYRDARSLRILRWKRRLEKFRGYSEKFRGRLIMLPDRRVLPFAAAMLLFMIAVVFPPVRVHISVPQEFPDLMFQGYIFGQNIFHGNDLDGAYAIHSYIPPGILSTLFIGGGSQLVDIVIIASVFLLLSMMMMWTGIYLFMGIMLPRRDFLRGLIAFFFVFGYHFWLGDMNFSMGFGLALAGLYLLIARRWIERPVAMGALLLLCYLGSFFSVVALAVGAVVWIIVERRYDLFRRVIPASLPALALLAYYCIHVHIPVYLAPADFYPTPYRYLHERGLIVAGMLAPFMNRHARGSMWRYDLSLVNLAYLVAVAVMAALCFLPARRAWSRPERFTLVLVIVSAVAVLAMPLQIAGVLYPAQGFVLFLLVNIIVLLLLRFPSSAVKLTPFYLMLTIVTGWMAADLMHTGGRGVRCFSRDSVAIYMPGYLDFYMHQDMMYFMYSEQTGEREWTRRMRDPILPLPVHPSGIIRNLPPTEEYFKQWR